MGKEKNIYYIDKIRMFDLVVKMKSEKGLTRREEDEIGRMVLLLVNRIATRPNFSGYTYIDEMKSIAVCHVWMAMKNFDPTKSNNAFSYFTTVVMNAFIYIINREKGLREKNAAFFDEAVSKANFAMDHYAKKKYTNNISDK